MDIDVIVMKITQLTQANAALEARVAALEAEVLPPGQGEEELDSAPEGLITETETPTA